MFKDQGYFWFLMCLGFIAMSFVPSNKAKCEEIVPKVHICYEGTTLNE